MTKERILEIIRLYIHNDEDELDSETIYGTLSDLCGCSDEEIRELGFEHLIPLQEPVNFEAPDSQLELVQHAYQNLLRYKHDFRAETTKAGLIDIVNHFGDNVFNGKLKLAIEALDNDDVEKAVALLGEIFG